MAETQARPSILWAFLFLLITIGIGAHLSAIPLMLVKVVVSLMMIGFYAFFAVRIIGALQIKSAGGRALVGLLLAAGTLYATWAIRIPAFSGWETAFTADPVLLLEAITDRAQSMRVTKSMGHGTSADGPSWLMFGTYILEAAATTGLMILGALLAFPDGKKAAAEVEGQPTQATA